MAEFDLGKAVQLTYSGLGAAFAVLVVLIAITAIVAQIERFRIKSGVPSLATEPAPQLERTAQPPEAVVKETSGDDEEGSRAATVTGDWKGFGKLEAFLSRRVGRRGS